MLCPGLEAPPRCQPPHREPELMPLSRPDPPGSFGKAEDAEPLLGVKWTLAPSWVLGPDNVDVELFLLLRLML